MSRESKLFIEGENSNNVEGINRVSIQAGREMWNDRIKPTELVKGAKCRATNDQTGPAPS
jgi:hypothetical protein